MADLHQNWNSMPAWSWLAPAAAGLLVAAHSVGLISTDNRIVAVVAVVSLGGVVFSAVHHAEVLAVRIGQPFGSILLTLAVASLEIGLIISVMATGNASSDTIARDTVFSVTMIVLNGIVGVCLVVGAWRHYEQEFKVQGAAGILSVIATLTIISLVLPSFTVSAPGPVFASNQLIFIGSVSFSLYILFVFVQTVRHRQDFITETSTSHHAEKPTNALALCSALLLLGSLVVVILLAKALSPVVERMVMQAGLPLTVVGVVIACVVLLPEGMTAYRAAARNRLQTSLNAALGSAAASIGLTIPIVGAASVLLGQTLLLGLNPASTTLLLLTLFVSTLTFATGRTTVLQGAVHLVIFAVFIFISAVP